MSQKVPEAVALTQRMQKPGLRDPKLLIGLLLIAVSISAVVGIIHVTNKTTTYYVAARDLTVGEQLTAEDIKPVEVNLADSAAHYLDSADIPADQSLIVDNIRAGQLISRTSLAALDPQGRRESSILLESGLAKNFTPGQRVDIWVSKHAETGNGYKDPQLIATGAEIASITAEESMIGGTGKSTVQLLLSEQALPNLLAAVNNEDKINLVPSTLRQENQQ